MANLNNLINRFVLQELGDITEGVRLVDNLIEHIDINESKYFMYRWVGLSYKAIHGDIFKPQVLLFLDLRGFSRRFEFPEIAAIVDQAKAGERQGQNETEKAKQLAPDRNGQQDDGRRKPHGFALET